VLPILTFDEARLSPSHGYIFNRRWLCPHETILGIAWKLARMNALPGHIVRHRHRDSLTDEDDTCPTTT
jgi:hypothetical protein